MQIKYIVEGKEFVKRQDAENYEHELLLSRSQFEVGDKCYFLENWTGNIIHDNIIDKKIKDGEVRYTFEHGFRSEVDKKCFDSIESLFAYLAATIIEY